MPIVELQSESCEAIPNVRTVCCFYRVSYVIVVSTNTVMYIQKQTQMLSTFAEYKSTDILWKK